MLCQDNFWQNISGGHFIIKTLPQCYSKVCCVAYLMKEKALGALWARGKKLCSYVHHDQASSLPQKCNMVKYVFEIHFDGDDQMNAILAPLIDCHNPAKNGFIFKGTKSSFLFASRAFSQNGRWIFNSRWTFSTLHSAEGVKAAWKLSLNFFPLTFFLAFLLFHCFFFSFPQK